MTKSIVNLKHLIKKYGAETMKYITNFDNDYYEEFLKKNGMKEIFLNLFSKVIYCYGFTEEEKTVITDFKGKFLCNINIEEVNHKGRPCDIEHSAIPIHERKEITMFILFLPDTPSEVEIEQKKITNEEITKTRIRLVWDGKNLNLLNFVK
jgi:hypothetical protein